MTQILCSVVGRSGRKDVLVKVCTKHMHLHEQIGQGKALFAKHFGGGVPSLVVRAPGRINLFGEHTGAGDSWEYSRSDPSAKCLAAQPYPASQTKGL